MTEHIDLCIIGGGEAGFSAAVAAAALGVRVTLIDDGVSDAVPTNDELVCAVLQREGHARLRSGAAADDRAWIDALRTALERAAPDRRLVRLSAMNIHVLRGRAGFADPDTVVVEGRTVRARRFFIASGSEQAVMRNADQGRILSLRTVPRLTSLPAPLLVIGGDRKSVSVAQSFRRLGAAVTLDLAGGMLPEIDPELALPLHAALVRDGVVLRDAEQPPRGRDTQSGFVAERGEAPDTAPSVFLPSASPALADLRLDRAGVTVTRDGRLVLTPALRTTNARVYAIGSVTGAGSPQAVQAQVGTVLKAAFLRLPVRYSPAPIPVCVATDPAIATVGLDEATARTRGEVRVWRWPFAETSAAWSRAGTSGHVKVITDRRGRVLGAGLVGAEAADLIGFWALALQRKLTLGQLADTPLPVPSASEAFRRVAILHTATRLQNPWFKRALALVNRLG